MSGTSVVGKPDDTSPSQSVLGKRSLCDSLIDEVFWTYSIGEDDLNFSSLPCPPESESGKSEERVEVAVTCSDSSMRTAKEGLEGCPSEFFNSVQFEYEDDVPCSKRTSVSSIATDVTNVSCSSLPSCGSNIEAIPPSPLPIECEKDDRFDDEWEDNLSLLPENIPHLSPPPADDPKTQPAKQENLREIPLLSSLPLDDFVAQVPKQEEQDQVQHFDECQRQHLLSLLQQHQEEGEEEKRRQQHLREQEAHREQMLMLLQQQQQHQLQQERLKQERLKQQRLRQERLQQEQLQRQQQEQLQRQQQERLQQEQLQQLQQQFIQQQQLLQQQQKPQQILDDPCQRLARMSVAQSPPDSVCSGIVTDKSLSQPSVEPNGPQAQVPYRMEVVGTMVTQWYTDRPFPQFAIRVVDAQTNQVAADCDHWKVVVCVMDAFGREAPSKLSEHTSGRMYDVYRGHATINGLRFVGVSSKSGGHFNLVVKVVHPSSASSSVFNWISPNLSILSYRLYHVPKVEFDRLTPGDKVGKMRGIGEMYAKRFASIGIVTVGQMASVDTNGDGLSRLLLRVRKERGSLTLTKLEAYVAQARGIVSRFNSQQYPDCGHPSKRTKMEHVV